MNGRDEIAVTVGSSGGPGVSLVHHLFSDEIDVDSGTTAHGHHASPELREGNCVRMCLTRSESNVRK
jgi:hypothetical protein